MFVCSTIRSNVKVKKLLDEWEMKIMLQYTNVLNFSSNQTLIYICNTYILSVCGSSFHGLICQPFFSFDEPQNEMVFFLKKKSNQLWWWPTYCIYLAGRRTDVLVGWFDIDLRVKLVDFTKDLSFLRSSTSGILKVGTVHWKWRRPSSSSVSMWTKVTFLTLLFFFLSSSFGQSAVESRIGFMCFEGDHEMGRWIALPWKIRLMVQDLEVWFLRLGWGCFQKLEVMCRVDWRCEWLTIYAVGWVWMVKRGWIEWVESVLWIQSRCARCWEKFPSDPGQGWWAKFESDEFKELIVLMSKDLYVNYLFI